MFSSLSDARHCMYQEYFYLTENKKKLPNLAIFLKSKVS